MSPTEIRRATGQDAEALTALMHASSAYQGQYAGMLTGYRVAPAYVERHPVFAAVDAAGRLLGFYALLVDEAELDLAFVADEAQGTGIGRRLMEHMLDRAAEAGLTHVRVVSNPPAEQFYRRMGAERVGTVLPSSANVTWERPELLFTVARTATRAAGPSR